MATSSVHPQSLHEATTPIPGLAIITNIAFGDVYELHRDQPLGEGFSGRVYRCTHRATQRPFAVKFLPDTWDGRNEVELHGRCLGHAGIVTVVACYRTIVALPEHPRPRVRLALVLEALPGGELFEVVRRRGAVAEGTARRVGRQLAAALAHIHKRGVVHRDVKLENVLLTPSNDLSTATVKLADFGFAAHGGTPRTPQYTANYVAPEVVAQLLTLQVQAYSAATTNYIIATTTPTPPTVAAAVDTAPTPAHDAWALGVVLYILLFGERPFYSQQQQPPSGVPPPDMMDQILGAQFHFPAHAPVSDTAKDLIRGLLALDPQQRLTPAAALEHEFLRVEAEELQQPQLATDVY